MPLMHEAPGSIPAPTPPKAGEWGGGDHRERENIWVNQEWWCMPLSASIWEGEEEDEE